MAGGWPESEEVCLGHLFVYFWGLDVRFIRCQSSIWVSQGKSPFKTLFQKLQKKFSPQISTKANLICGWCRWGPPTGCVIWEVLNLQCKLSLPSTSVYHCNSIPLHLQLPNMLARSSPLTDSILPFWDRAGFYFVFSGMRGFEAFWDHCPDRSMDEPWD